MAPDYVIGDVLLARKGDLSEIQVGDDVVYKGTQGDFADKIVTHRVIEIENQNGTYIFHTQGIANFEKDPPVSGEQIIGEVKYKIKSLSLVTKTINNLYSFYFIVFIPVVVLLFIEVRKAIVNRRER